MASRRIALALAAATVIAACGSSSDLGAPVITSVSPGPPEFRWTYEDVLVVIEGENFAVGITPDAEDADASKADAPTVTLTGPNVGTLVVASATILSPTLIEAWLPADTFALADLLDVTVRNPDGQEASLAGALMLRSAPTRLVLSSAVEAAPGTSNEVTISVTAMDALALVSPLRVPLSATILLYSSSGVGSPVATPAALVMAVGDTAASFTITSARAEPVDVEFDAAALAAAGITEPVEGEGKARFIPGPPALARLVGGSTRETFFVTDFRIEDADGNVCDQHLRFDVVFDDPPTGCPTGQVSPTTATVGSNLGISPPITVSCGNTGTVTVTYSEDTTSTGYNLGTASTTVVFQ